MRILILAFAASALVLAGCGKKQETGNTSALDEAVSARDFATNDVTAIDAATGADANMAADVDINYVSNAGDDEAGARAPRPSRPRAGTATAGNSTNSAEETPAPAPAPAPAQPAPPAESNSN